MLMRWRIRQGLERTICPRNRVEQFIRARRLKWKTLAQPETRVITYSYDKLTWCMGCFSCVAFRGGMVLLRDSWCMIHGRARRRVDWKTAEEDFRGMWVVSVICVLTRCDDKWGGNGRDVCKMSLTFQSCCTGRKSMTGFLVDLLKQLRICGPQ